MKVYLVGAGPGDPGLITVKGRKIQIDPYRPQEPGAQKYRGERKRRPRVKRSTSNGTA